MFHNLFLKPKRWNASDKYYGNLTVSKSNYSTFAFVISSGEEEWPGASIRLCIGQLVVILSIPQFFIPTKKKTIIVSNKSYTIEEERMFGCSFFENYISVYTGQGENTSIGMFLPWNEWRHVRHSLYDLDGNHFSSGTVGEVVHNELNRKEHCPSVSFSFRDFDGELLTAKTRIEEREWHRGTGSFSWLSFFYSPKIVRSLQIEFSGETGPKKGSWKGGTLGHGIEMLPEERHIEAFKRYCLIHNMKIESHTTNE